MSLVVAVILSYLIGSIPFAYIAGRMVKGVDIRKIGSGNMGAMNVFYTVGFWPGLAVGIADVGKGALAVYVGTLLLQLSSAQPLTVTIIQMVCGLCAMAGHSYPVYFKFKRGGRGAATAGGAVAFLVPMGIPLFIVLFLLLLAITRYPTLCYAVAFLVFPAIAWVQWATPIDTWLNASLPGLAWLQSRAVIPAQHILLIIYSLVLIILPVLFYIPRIKQILSKSGSFQKAAFRKDLEKDKPTGY
ncbi:MAG: glycerol-3-phosphate acyltransferase [Chloroflexi bacterium]|nr:glycerol-3-phosphate acyltransferase [Chloroflexota bacterium]